MRVAWMWELNYIMGLGSVRLASPSQRPQSKSWPRVGRQIGGLASSSAELSRHPPRLRGGRRTRHVARTWPDPLLPVKKFKTWRGGGFTFFSVQETPYSGRGKRFVGRKVQKGQGLRLEGGTGGSAWQGAPSSRYLGRQRRQPRFRTLPAILRGRERPE